MIFEDLADDGRLDRVDHEPDGFPVRLPAPGGERQKAAVGLNERPAVAVWRATAGPLPARGMGAVTALDELAELLAVLVREDALQGLDDLATDTALVDEGIVRVDDAHPNATERVLVVGRFIGIQPREARNVVTEDEVGCSARGIGAELEQILELAPTSGIEPRGIVGKFPDDVVAMGARPGLDPGPLLLDREVLGAR